ncbi:glycosyltransferase family 2 protein [Leuconostoc inhae]|uniref:glycosyltransferase family 2 protein n=1 Tax=Leuconostoc inhae TaxID=178001 RepID=UPI001C7C9F73|nr:glycosyltransferase family 2 protein [Leuconostoc inhae]
MSRMKKIYYAGALVCSIVYLVWRLIFTVPFNQSFFEMIYGILLWVSEVLSIATAFILIWNNTTYRSTPKPVVTSADVFPEVDILIATHNENVELLYQTINACTFLRYPDKNKIHVYLCDDQNRAEMKALAQKFDINYIGLSHNQHAKSGNFNHALKYSHSPLVATFDADMIPYADFLTTVVPYFFASYGKRVNKKIGFVQTPQSFYNEDVFQHNLYANRVIPNEQDFFSKEVNVLNASHSSAIYTGSNTLFLREAIVEAGGFPTNTLTEDFQLGAQINSCGYSSISTTEPMGSGLTPTDTGSVFKQRTRWARGMIQSTKNLHLLTNKGLTWKQKLIYFNGYLYWWSFLGRMLFVFAPILFALFGFRVVNTNFWLLLIFWIPGYLLLLLVKQDISSNLTNQRWGEIQELFFAPYLVVPVILETIGIKNSRFKVTKKNISGNNKKDFLYMIPHVIILVLTIVSLIKFNYGKFGSEIMYGSVITFWLLNNLINTFLAVLVFIGKHNNEEPKFAVEGQVHISDIQLTTNVVINYLTTSEIAIHLPQETMLRRQKRYDVTIETSQYTADVGAYFKSFDEQDGCILKIEANDELNYQILLQIIHDGFNKRLPQKRDKWVTTFDLLFENINKRIERLNTALPKGNKE